MLGALEGFAFDEGVRPGDQILRIDGKELTGLKVDEVKNLLRGEPVLRARIRPNACATQFLRSLIRPQPLRRSLPALPRPSGLFALVVSDSPASPPVVLVGHLGRADPAARWLARA